MPSGERGAIYLALLVFMAIMGIAMAAVGPLIQASMQREREAELLAVGDEFRRAILLYYESSPGVKRYPRQLQELIEDSRFPVPRRHLRRIYRDPMTNSAEWGIVPSGDGGIKGVFSKGGDQPFKRDGFPLRYKAFQQGKTYADWRFVYEPPAMR